MFPRRGRMNHRIVIIGGGTAGLSVAARWRRLGMRDVALVEPASTHCYQPLFSFVGAAAVALSCSARSEVDLVPQGVAWIRDAVAANDPSERLLQSESGARIRDDAFWVLALGLSSPGTSWPGSPRSWRARPPAPTTRPASPTTRVG